MGDYPGLSEWSQCNHNAPHKRETRGSEGKKGMWQQKRIKVRERFEAAELLALKMGKATSTKESRQPLANGNGN